MWSLVGSTDNRQWIWLAIDERSAAIVGVYVGTRDRSGAEGLWRSLPAVYRPGAMADTDFWSSYAESFPASRHRAGGKETGRTNQIERFHNTMLQRISRLARKPLSCSKKLVNHIGAIWLFVHHDNASLGL